MRRLLITGGAGFIGSALVRYILGATADQVLVVDKLTYVGNLDSLAPVVPITVSPMPISVTVRQWRGCSQSSSRTASCI